MIRDQSTRFFFPENNREESMMYYPPPPTTNNNNNNNNNNYLPTQYTLHPNVPLQTTENHHEKHQNIVLRPGLFQSLEYNLNRNIKYLIARLRTPIQQLLHREYDKVSQSLLMGYKSRDIITKELLLAVIQRFAQDMSILRWKHEDVQLIAQESMSNMYTRRQKQQATYHYLSESHFRPCRPDLTMLEVMRAHHKLIFWSKRLNPEDILTLDQMDGTVSDDYITHIWHEVCELSLEHARILVSQRPGIFWSANDVTMNEQDDLLYKRQQLVEQAIQQAIDDMLQFDLSQSSILPYHPMSSFLNKGPVESELVALRLQQAKEHKVTQKINNELIQNTQEMQITRDQHEHAYRTLLQNSLSTLNDTFSSVPDQQRVIDQIQSTNKQLGLLCEQNLSLKVLTQDKAHDLQKGLELIEKGIVSLSDVCKHGLRSNTDQLESIKFNTHTLQQQQQQQQQKHSNKKRETVSTELPQHHLVMENRTDDIPTMTLAPRRETDLYSFVEP